MKARRARSLSARLDTLRAFVLRGEAHRRLL